MAKIFAKRAAQGMGQGVGQGVGQGTGLAMRIMALLLAALPVMAAAQSSRPAIDSDLMPSQANSASSATANAGASYATPSPAATASPSDATARPPYQTPTAAGSANGQAAVNPNAPLNPNDCAPSHYTDGTYHQDDLIGAAEGVFGKGAHGLADIIQDILKKQGRPDGYIVGREAGGAFAVGLRYGSGTLCSLPGGKSPVYWTGPSIGFDVGANAANTFVLVYNLYHNQDIFHRFGAGEGQAYLVGGFNVSYLRYGDIVLIPVRMGVGLRLGVNAGYMKFSPHQRWLPF